jgi:hypothetical protein
MNAPADMTADHLVMLLSTDWFLPHWPLIGIDAGSNDSALQQRCRSIVRDLIGGASEYYHISFSEERLTATRTALVRAAVDCSLRPAAATQIERICVPKSDRDEQHKAAWVLLDVVGPEMLQDQHLEPALRTALNGAKKWFEFDAELLEQRCIESRTEWDSYIRDLTPEQPSALFDFVAAGLIVEAQFAFVLNQLTTAQQNLLMAVCRKRRSQITGLPERDLW